MKQLNSSDIVSALELISPFIHQTPVLTSRTLNERIERNVYFKCENFQKTGAFKARGACNAVFSLPSDVRSVVTHSSGNHGAALSWAASLREIRTFVICPVDASPAKRANIMRYGGEIVDCGSSLKDRETALSEFLARSDATFIPPYDDPKIITGQGTCTLEFLAQVPELKEVWVPIGGGGLISGAVLASKGRATVVGAEPELARDAHDSLEAGKRLPALPPRTCADGLRTQLGVLNFSILHDANTRVVLVTEDELLNAQKMIWEHLKIVIERSSAVPVAALIKSESSSHNGVGVILSGGNAEI